MLPEHRVQAHLKTRHHPSSPASQ